MRSWLICIFVFLNLRLPAQQIIADTLALKLKLKSVTETIRFDNKERSVYRVTEHYDHNGKCVKKTMFDVNAGRPEQSDHYSYDKTGRLLGHKHIRYRGKDTVVTIVPVSGFVDSINRPRYTYDSLGRVAVCREGGSITYYEYKCDSNGRIEACEMKTMVGEAGQFLLKKETRFYFYHAGAYSQRSIEQHFNGDEPGDAAPLNENEIKIEFDRRGLPKTKKVTSLIAPIGVPKNNPSSEFKYEFYR